MERAKGVCVLSVLFRVRVRDFFMVFRTKMSDSEMAPVVSAEEQALKRAKMVADNKKQTQIVANEFEGRFASSSLSTHQVEYGFFTPTQVLLKINTLFFLSLFSDVFGRLWKSVAHSRTQSFDFAVDEGCR